MGDLIISARKGDGAVHPLNVQWRSRCPLFRGFRTRAFERELLPLSASNALMPSSTCCASRNFGEFYDLSLFCRHVSSVLDIRIIMLQDWSAAQLNQARHQKVSGVSPVAGAADKSPVFWNLLRDMAAAEPAVSANPRVPARPHPAAPPFVLVSPRHHQRRGVASCFLRCKL